MPFMWEGYNWCLQKKIISIFRNLITLYLIYAINYLKIISNNFKFIVKLKICNQN